VADENVADENDDIDKRYHASRASRVARREYLIGDADRVAGNPLTLG
jgi:hypothetical protein